MSDSTVQIVGNNVVMPTGGKVTNLGAPTAAADAVTKAYADALTPAVTESAVRAAAAAFTAALAVNGQKITGLGTPTVSTDAVTKAYADALTPAVSFSSVNTALAGANASINVNNQKVTGLATPTTSTDAVTKAYADALSPSVTESAVRAAAAAFTAAFNVNGQKITGLGTPTVSTDAVTKAYADSLSGAVTETAVRAAAASFSASLAVNGQKITGLANGTVATDAVTLGQFFARNGKPTVNAVATSNQATLSGLAQTIDGVALSVAGMLVALTNQTTGTQTGIYAVASGAWTLIPELASGASAAGAYFVCKTGTSNKGVWVVTNAPGSDVVGTATLAFVNVAGAGGGGGAPAAHAASHATGGSDAITPASINAVDAGRIETCTLYAASLPAYTYANGTSGVGATITLNSFAALPTIDGQTGAVGLTILYNDGTSAAGRYSIISLGNGSSTSTVLMRPTDADTASKLRGSIYGVAKGTAFSGTLWILPLKSSEITVGTTALTWVRQRLDQLAAPTADVPMAGFGNTNVRDGVADTDYASFGQVQRKITKSVTCRSTAALAGTWTYSNGTSGVGATMTRTTNGALETQDTVTLTTLSRVWVSMEAAPERNGIYNVTVVGDAGTACVLTRATDADTSAKLRGSVLVISDGKLWKGTEWVLEIGTDDTLTVGTTALAWVYLAGFLDPNVYHEIKEDYECCPLAGVNGTMLAGSRMLSTFAGTSSAIASQALSGTTLDCGIMRCTAGSTAASNCSSTTGTLAFQISVDQEVYIAFRGTFGDTLSDGTNTYISAYGLFNGTTAVPTSAIMMRYAQAATNGTNILCTCALNGTGTTETSSGTAVAAGQKYRGEMIKPAGSSTFTFRVDGVAVATIGTANVPFNTSFTLGHAITKSAGAALRFIDTDSIYLRRLFPAGRAA